MDSRTENDWLRVREIFDAALRTSGADRLKLVTEACAGDVELRSEIESLLASYDETEDFLETPAAIHVAENVLASEAQLLNGQILGDYEILELLGSGGMGEVYLARDLKLDRRAAIKLLRKSFLPHEKANRRLLREARAAALLEHPNICQIYQVGETEDHAYIVMQYVQGSTLADILSKDSLTKDRSLDLVIQIADGLAEAHARGIIHRDIKPANIIVNEKGQAKILDFGLAKIVEGTAGADNITSSGPVMGTVPFMSPEHLRGKDVDARTDVFSVGALLFEMVTGQPAFSRDSNAETISAILNQDPAYLSLPRELRDIARRCLAKSKEDRYASASELAADLRVARDAHPGTTDRAGAATPTGGLSKKKRSFYFWQSADDVTPGSPFRLENAVVPKRSGRTLIVAVAVVVLSAIGGIAWLAWRDKKPVNELSSLTPVRLAQWRSGGSSNDTDYRVSHDGKLIAYTSSKPEGGEAIYVKQTSDGEEVRVTKDEWRNVSPIWSPDDQRLAYVSIRDDRSGIYVSPSLGGAATPLKISEKTNIALRHWSADGSAIFYEQSGNLYRLDIGTQQSDKLTSLPDRAGGDSRYFNFSPDERSVVFSDERDGQDDLWMLRLDESEPSRITQDADAESRPLWHPDGKQILYNVARNDFLQIQSVPVSGGQPIQVTRGSGSYELIDLSPDGSKIYYTSWEKRSDISLVNVDSGEESEVAAAVEAELWPNVSPDGTTIVFQRNGSPNPTLRIDESILMLRTESGTTPLTQAGFNPRWLPDRKRIAFLRPDPSSQRPQLWLVDSTTGEELQITTQTVQSPSFALMPISRSGSGDFDFSSDSQRFVFVDALRPRTVWLGTVGSSEVSSLSNTQSADLNYSAPKFSPDGKLVVWSWSCRASRSDKGESGIAIRDGEQTRIIVLDDESSRIIGWTSDARLLIVSAEKMGAGPRNASLRVTSLNGKGSTSIPLHDVYTDTFVISADGRVVAFVARRNDKDDLWLLALDSGASRKVTNNGNTRMFYANPAWSPNGKTIYFDKQEQVNTISMFEELK